MNKSATFFLLITLLFTGTSNAQIEQDSRFPAYWETDTAIRNIDLSELRVLLDRDCIPPIDNPDFVDINEAANYYVSKTDSGYVDTETQSVWDITGKAVRGELAGSKLNWIFHGNHFAFA